MGRRPLNALILEDSEDDALLLVRELGQQGFDVKWERTWTASAMKACLEAKSWDVVLSDYSMGGFDAPAALRLLQETGKELPFIVISGTIGEEAAVAAMRNGAHDYLMKGHLKRLGAAIVREIRDAGIRREHRLAIAKIQHLNRVLRAIRNVKQLIVREKDLDLLLRECCNELVNSRGYRAAWIAITEPSAASGRIAAERGFGDTFSEMRQRLVEGFVPACCAKALGAGRPYQIHDSRGECPADCPMIQAEDSGCRSAAMTMIAPLHSNEKNYGYVCVQVPEGLDTDDEETSLLWEVAGDIAFAFWSNEVDLQRREADELFQLSFENSSIGNSLTTPDGRLAKINQAFCDLLGYSHEELESKNFAEVIHPDDLAESRESARCLLAGEQRNYRMVKRYLRKDGKIVWADVSTILLRNDDGSPRRFITHVLDISVRKQAEEDLTKSETRFRTLYESSTDAVMLLDEKEFLDCNPATLREFGCSKKEAFCSKHPAECSPANQPCGTDSMTLSSQHISTAMEKGSVQFEWVHKRLDTGEDFPAEVWLSRMNLDGHMVLQATVRNITERKKYQAQVVQSDRLASMGMLAAGVAHEINNPLAYMLYNLESLSDDLPKISSALRRCLGQLAERFGQDEWANLLGPDLELLNPSTFDDIQARFKDALQGTHRIKDIARGLGTFSRVDQGRLVSVNLVHVIEVAINMAFNEIKYRARLVKDYGKTSSITANDGRLSQVFLNLLINAAHAIPEGNVEGSAIRIRTWQEGNEVFAEISDTGKGITPEHLPHLFEPFFTTKEIGVGTGLGLPISKNIVESYGGRIEVTSKVGEGSSFVVRLPVRSAEDYDLAPRSEEEIGEPQAHGRILVVDDEPGIRSAMVRMLGGNDVIQAGSGEEAQKILQADQAFDLVLCDMMMPTMSGVDLHEWLVSTYPTLARQVIFITGGAFTPRARDYLAKVSNIRLEKPFDVANFKKIVRDRIFMAQNAKPA